jgi:ATP-dependent Clp protease adaptor protein ClpS
LVPRIFVGDFEQNQWVPTVTPVRNPDLDQELDDDTRLDIDKPWVVLVWNDPINLMSYVTMVFQKVFGFSKAKAHSLMLDVHEKGRATVFNGAREKAEMYVFRLHEHGLWATMQQD